MAIFNPQGFCRTSAGDFGASQAPVDFNYDGARFSQTLAEINTLTFFLPVVSQLTVGAMIKVKASDAPSTSLVVTVITPTAITLVADENLTPPDSISTAMLQDECVTFAKLSGEFPKPYYKWAVNPAVGLTSLVFNDANTTILTPSWFALYSSRVDTNTQPIKAVTIGTGEFTVYWDAPTTLNEFYDVMIFKYTHIS